MPDLNFYASNDTMQKLFVLKGAAEEHDLSGNDYAAVILEDAVNQKYDQLIKEFPDKALDK